MNACLIQALPLKVASVPKSKGQLKASRYQSVRPSCCSEESSTLGAAASATSEPTSSAKEVDSAILFTNTSEADAKPKPKGSASTLVKICGVTTPKDAAFAAQQGADFIGMIIWPRAKRSVSISVAKEISRAARQKGAEPVGVFVDEDAEAIERACSAADIRIAQLHGDAARAAFPLLPPSLSTIYVLHANGEGKILTPLPGASDRPWQRHLPDWVLVDGLKGGSGESFDWTNLEVPHGVAEMGWILAGGLHPDNVAEALSTLNPHCVDVSSGVAGEDKVNKDFEKVAKFIAAARGEV